MKARGLHASFFQNFMLALLLLVPGVVFAQADCNQKAKKQDSLAMVMLAINGVGTAVSAVDCACLACSCCSMPPFMKCPMVVTYAMGMLQEMMRQKDADQIKAACTGTTPGVINIDPENLDADAASALDAFNNSLPADVRSKFDAKKKLKELCPGGKCKNPKDVIREELQAAKDQLNGIGASNFGSTPLASLLSDLDGALASADSGESFLPKTAQGVALSPVSVDGKDGDLEGELDENSQPTLGEWDNDASKAGKHKAGPADRSGLGKARLNGGLDMLDDETGKSLTIWQRATRRYQGDSRGSRALFMAKMEYMRKKAAGSPLFAKLKKVQELNAPKKPHNIGIDGEKLDAEPKSSKKVKNTEKPAKPALEPPAEAPKPSPVASAPPVAPVQNGPRPRN